MVAVAKPLRQTTVTTELRTLTDEDVVVGEQIGPLQNTIQLQLGLVRWLRGHGDWW